MSVYHLKPELVRGLQSEETRLRWTDSTGQIVTEHTFETNEMYALMEVLIKAGWFKQWLREVGVEATYEMLEDLECGR